MLGHCSAFMFFFFYKTQPKLSQVIVNSLPKQTSNSLNSNSTHDKKTFSCRGSSNAHRHRVIFRHPHTCIFCHLTPLSARDRRWFMCHVESPDKATQPSSAAGECFRWTTKVGFHLSHSLSRSSRASNGEDIVWNWIKVLCVHLFPVMHEHGLHRKKFSIWCEFGISCDARWWRRLQRRRALREYLALNPSVTSSKCFFFHVQVRLVDCPPQGSLFAGAPVPH